jgi:hypothetical protein
MTSPRIRNTIEAKGGLRVNALGELHRSVGTEVTDRKLTGATSGDAF